MIRPGISHICVLLIIAALVVSGCPKRILTSNEAHHTETGFRNVYLSEKPGFGAFLKWRWERVWKNVPSPDLYQFPIASGDPQFLQENREKTTLTWIGHATVLLQMGGRNILTDPHFSLRASPVQWAGPKRVVEPGLSFADLPPIDIVLISHDHYDSLDEETVKKLRERPGGQLTTFYVPLGLKSWLQVRGVSRAVEMDWWQRQKDGPLEITAVPVQHWSKRSLFSRNKSLWAGWVVRSDDFSFFFCGDSGYTPHFKEIGRILGPFDLAAIPIGAYEPRWFMKNHHINPEESVIVHKDVRSKRSVAIHWGTFILTDEPLDEPPQRLRRAMKEQGLGPQDFVVLQHGETIIE
ncbi:MAG: MBL fold metallo-hydrolase [Desulforhabdus sp.]|jgi:L-ascorbate metabolism protein UlaG (beta-lactamase superfamily)|nr:MBL fold metallo-hydrolase [Desulforhabdus sp.]